MGRGDGRDHAVVLGGSMAGLLAARVLAESYARVTVVDRDELPAGPVHRRGVPQAHHVHALLARGQQIIEELFPGLTADLRASGVPCGDMLADARLHFSGHRLRQASSGLVLVSVSRIFLENEVRRRVRALPGVSFSPPTDALGLTITPDGQRVHGVVLLSRVAHGTPRVQDADLVVDATGRGSRAPAWLESLGFERAEEDHVRVDLRYTSRRYRLPPDALGGDLATLYAPSPASPRGGVIARLEGDQWLVTLAGILGDKPPTDPEGFLEFARSLPVADIHDAIEDAEPLDEPVAYRFPASVRRRYERLDRLPEGFLPLGDSLCSFNPIYGQGMTVAALEARALRSHLQRNGRPSCRRLLADLARVVDTPWELARGADLAFPGVEGRRTWALRFIGNYITRLHAAATHDARLGVAFVRVMGLVDEPGALLRPGVALRVLRRPARDHGQRATG